MAPTLELGRRATELRQRLARSSEGGAAASACRSIVEFGILPAGASTLWRALAIYRLACRHPELFHYQHLGVAHVSLLLRVRGPLQLALLRRAERRRWSRARLQNRLAAIGLALEHGEALLEQFAEELRIDPSTFRGQVDQ